MALLCWGKKKIAEDTRIRTEEEIETVDFNDKTTFRVQKARQH